MEPLIFSGAFLFLAQREGGNKVRLDICVNSVSSFLCDKN